MDNLTRKKLQLLKMKKAKARTLLECFSADNSESRPTAEQQRFLDDIHTTPIRWAVSSNRAGKSQAAAREFTWLFTDTHPEFKFKETEGPKTFIILCKKLQIMEEELWSKKILPLLGDANITVRRGSSGIESARNEDNGNIVIFQSHNNPSEARKNIQGYSAHYVWLDEMPEDVSLISELMMRILDVDGRLVATFTPLVHNVQVKQVVESADGEQARIYKFLLRDNPKFAGRLDKVLTTIRQACATEEEFQCRVNGEWMGAGHRVSSYSAEKHKEDLPEYYSARGWRHILVVDPASSGKIGVTIWGEDPTQQVEWGGKTYGVWYNVYADYITGDAPSTSVADVEKIAAAYNITQRKCDPNPAGFYKEAAKMGIPYLTVTGKSNRKQELINNSNEVLKVGVAKLTQYSGILEDELATCVWSETNPDKIVKAQRFHTFDCFQYSMDSLPVFDPQLKQAVQTLRQQYHAQKKKKLDQQKKKAYTILGRQRRAFANKVRRSR